MIDTLHWSTNNAPLWLAAVLAAAAIVHLAIALPRRAGFRQKLFVCALNVICAVALWAFVSPPTVTGGAAEAVLLTAGATQDETARAARASAAFAMPGIELTGNAARRVEPVGDLAALRRSRPELTTVRVLGAGLAAAQWYEQRHWDIRFSPSPAPEGFVDVQWRQRLAAGERFTVTGAVHLTQHAQAVVRLVDPSGLVVASSAVNGEGDTAALRFSLGADIRASGRFAFELHLDTSTGDSLVVEQVPVSVYDPPAVRMLILLSSPSFENRAMISWARQTGATLAVRTAISRDRHRTVFYGQTPVNLDTLHAALLRTFDIVVSDARQWNALPERARAALAQAVTSDGLGLLVTVSDDEYAVGGPLPWPEHRIAEGKTHAVDLTDAEAVPAVLSHAAGALAAESGEAMVYDQRLRPVAGWQQHGSGKLALTFVTDSYALVTSGYAASHARYWQKLIDNTRKSRPSVGFHIAPALPLVNWRLQLCAFGDGIADTASLNGDTIVLAVQPLAPGQRCGYAWPARPGWQRLEVSGHSRDLYVYPPTAWRTERFLNRTAATQLAAQRPKVLHRGAGRSRKPLPAWWFFLAFTGAAGLLWLEQKASEARSASPRPQ